MKQTMYIYEAKDPISGIPGVFSNHADAVNYATSGRILLGEPIKFYKLIKN